MRRTLIPFHTIAKEEIERFGGTLDKFVGDAAMGVFGAPVAHEDDPERAVRAALAIQARTGDMAIPVRAAVNTGEAVVTFATGPQIGENVAGDVVNTASRLQGVAPHGGVVVGESTYRSTRDAVDYRELEPVEVKGKADPLRVWLVGSVRTETPGRADEGATPFVGRERERHLLRELFDRSVRESSLQLVTIVGEPGIGKTRLVADLHEHLSTGTAPVTWYRGRCLPYGESVTFAPLEEIVREATGVMRSDDREEAAGKLADHIARLEPRVTEAEWLRARLAPLIGLAEPSSTAPDRAESFTAWARFLVAEASRSPLVLAVEDLHWADQAMLDFLDQLDDQADVAPILLVGTARPELFDVRPGWGGGKANASTITLSPLPEDAMQQLLAELLVRSVLPADTQAPLVQSAGGNPLYALEFVRMLGDRGVVDDAGSIALPDSIQALIAARLDALTPGQRSLLQDAAVVGDHFWSGAVASMNTGEVDVAERLRELQRRGMIRRSSTQTIEDQDELSFSHGLVRDVAYKQIPRAGRVDRHLAVARWLEETAGDRLEDRAEPLAYHTTEALSLARAAHLPHDTPELQDEARRFLLMAGKRQTSLDVAQAAVYYERALELTPADHPDRSRILREATGFRWRSGRLSVDDAVSAYEEALDLALSNDDREAAAFALRRLYFQLGFRGDSEAARAALERGIELLEGREPSPALAELYAALAEDEMFAGRSEESLRWATRALELPHSDSIAVMTLHIRGNGRLELGDLGGMDDLREALHQAEASGSALDQATSYSYLSEWVGVIDGPIRGLEMNDASIEICDRRGIQGQGMWGRAESLWLLYDAGRWDDLLDVVATLLPWVTEHGDTDRSSRSDSATAPGSSRTVACSTGSKRPCSASSRSRDRSATSRSKLRCSWRRRSWRTRKATERTHWSTFASSRRPRATAPRNTGNSSPPRSSGCAWRTARSSSPRRSWAIDPSTSHEPGMPSSPARRCWPRRAAIWRPRPGSSPTPRRHGPPTATRSSARMPSTAGRAVSRSSAASMDAWTRATRLRSSSPASASRHARRRPEPMLLADLVDTSAAVASTRSRLAKVEAIAESPGSSGSGGGPDRRELPLRRAATTPDRRGVGVVARPAAAGDRADAHGRRGGRRLRSGRGGERAGIRRHQTRDAGLALRPCHGG